MFSLQFDRKHRVLWTRFAGVCGREDALAAAAALRKFATTEGQTRAVFDFRDIEKIDISIESFQELAKRPQVVANQFRVYLVSSELQFGLARMFATHQSLSGNVEPVIVRTEADAYSTLEIADPAFEPVPDIA